MLLDYVRQNEIQGRNMVFFKAHAYSILFCLTWSIKDQFGIIQNQEFRREGWTETAIILCKLNKSL